MTRYQEFAPSPSLRGIVERLWVLESNGASRAVDPILPDGHAEIVVHRKHPFEQVLDDGVPRLQARVLLAGQMNNAVHLQSHGAALVAGARLLPYGAAALLRIPQHELADRIVELAALDAGLAARLDSDVVDGPTAAAVAGSLDRALVQFVMPRVALRTPAAVSLALRRHGLVDVDRLARALGRSARQLDRDFRHEVGLAPKRFLRILRFQEVLHQLREPAQGGWAGLAARMGFYDQAHLINDFREFAGTSPSRWQVSEESLTAVFSALRRSRRSEDVRFLQDDASG